LSRCISVNEVLGRGGFPCRLPVLLMPWHESNGMPFVWLPGHCVLRTAHRRIVPFFISRQPVPSRPASFRLDGNGQEGGLLRIHSRAVHDGGGWDLVGRWLGFSLRRNELAVVFSRCAFLDGTVVGHSGGAIFRLKRSWTGYAVLSPGREECVEQHASHLS
jgi:hypothetical protein